MKKPVFILLAAMMLGACTPQKQEQLTMLVGTYTYDGSHGIYSFRFNQETGQAELLDSLPMRNPSYLTISKNGQTVYAVSETNDDDASLAIIRLQENGAMKLLQSVPTDGGDPCYVSSNGKMVLTANYSGGSMSVFALSDDGSRANPPSLFPGDTGGPDLLRQQLPHVHCACFAPDGEYVLATDFSADRILSFRISGETVEADGVAVELNADSGPRHLVFSPDGRFAYLMSELSGKVTVFRYQAGRLQTLGEFVSDSVGARGGADIHLNPDGRFLYSSNRLQADGLAIFSVDSASGLLTRVGYQPTGAHPRQFQITPNGQFLLCCCRDSNIIQVFRCDRQTGLLTDTHQDILLRRPVCVQFTPNE